mgnify:CR=1 FL=1
MVIITDEKNGTTRHITAIPEGVCSRLIDLTLNGDVIEKVTFTSGCNGNLQGIAALVKGMTTKEAASKLRGIMCGTKGTSCPDQFAKLLDKI